MMTQLIKIPRWRAAVLCLAGILAMTKPLATGVSMYRATLPAPVRNFSEHYGWVEETGPFNHSELWRAQARLRLTAFPREQFTSAEIESVAAEIRTLGLAEVHQYRADARAKADQATGERAVAIAMAATGAGGMVFYVWLGVAMLRESAEPRARDPLQGWFGRKKRHGRITFGRIAA